jgi:hypothetical protein
MRKVEWNRKTVSVVLLAVVLPISLAVALQLTDKGIVIAENTTLDPVVWTFQRPNPNQYVIIGDRLEPSYSSGELSATFLMWLSDYLPRVGSLNYDTLRVRLEINATTTSPNGFVESVHVVAHKDQESKVSWQEDDLYLKNLSLVASADGYRLSTQAYIKLAGVNRTSSVYADTTAFWKLLTPNTQSHQMEIAYEITYYNGTAYNRVVQPFQLNIIGAEGE